MARSSSTERAPVTVTVEDLVLRAEVLSARSSRTILGIVGAPGAGKSTLCTALDEALGSRTVIVGMDGFHLADDVLDALGRRHRKGALDTFDVAGYVSLLRRLKQATEKVTYAPRFDRGLEASLGSAIPVQREIPLVITEGNYLLHHGGGWEDVRPLLDEVWFLDVPTHERVRRLLARRLSFGDTDDHARSWVTEVDEANASIIVDGSDAADLVVRLVATPT